MQSKFRFVRNFGIFVGCLALLAGGAALISCGTNGGAPGSGMGKAMVSISDPATCAGPDGPYAHVYVTITDVQASTSATAGNSDSGWTDLTPKLSSQPKQIDLLGQADNKCFLATLGDAQELQAGNYQQIRLMLASNTTSVSNNACASAGTANCVVLTADSSVHALQLSSEAKTGIKIPSGQIASGGFNIAAGQTKDLDIDFNTCASIVQEGNGQYRLKPVLHAGEVSTTSTSINGTVLDSATGKPVDGQVMVALEQKDSAGVDRIVMTTMTNTDGSFVFCPIPEGTYDVVVVGMGTSGTAYQPSIVTGVANGQTTGTVNLYAGTAGTATFTGLVTSQNSSSAGTVADVQLSALETDSASGATFTIPLLPTATQSSATLMVETAASSGTLTCPNGTDCANYTMVVPGGGAYIGVYATTGSTLTQSAALATYVIDGTTETCTPMEVKSAANALTGTGPFTIAVSDALAFVACQ
ncbi:MAG TPA: DUF4382 domain-containing protein [Terriglobia bacterium]|nr:DUF4382 domain-containing protein [Terriglobia bacterium]